MNDSILPTPPSAPTAPTSTVTYQWASPSGNAGPITLDQAKELIAAGTLTPETYVLREGAGEWAPARKMLPSLFPRDIAQRTTAAPFVPISPSEMRYAGFWTRFAALGLDCLILGAAGGVIEVVCLLLDVTVIFAPIGILLQFVSSFAGFAYAPVMHALYGRTLGMRIMGQRLVTVGGGKVKVGACIGRQFAAVLSGLALFIGYFANLWSPRRQTWHDALAGTVVVEAE